MRRKYKGRWEVTTNAGLYYSERKWMEYKDVKMNSSTHAFFKTKKRAFRSAVGLMKKTNYEVVVCHWYYRKGHRFLREWVAKEVNSDE